MDKHEHARMRAMRKELPHGARVRWSQDESRRTGVPVGLPLVDTDPRLPVGLSECYRFGLAGLCGEACPAHGSKDDCP